MTFKHLKISVIIATLAASGATAAPTPAWRPDSRDALMRLIACEALVREEIVQREETLPQNGKWSLLHQALWRLEAERALLSAVVRAVVDRETLPHARAAALPDGVESLADRERRRAVNDCAPLAVEIHASGAADGADLAPLPRLSLLSLSRLASEAAED